MWGWIVGFLEVSLFGLYFRAGLGRREGRTKNKSKSKSEAGLRVRYQV
jgi:hypothetical protein